MRNLILFTFALLLLACQEKEKPMENHTLFVGTYTDGDSEGIYSFSYDSETGAMDKKTMVAALDNPSFLKISPDGGSLYTVLETDAFTGGQGGIKAFEIKEDGTLSAKGPKALVGAHPCHISLSNNGRELAVSTYTGGSLSIFQCDEHGGVKPDPQVIDLTLKDSTKTSHAHASAFTVNGLFISDLGMDALFRYQKEDGQYVTAPQSSVPLPQGAGPRHFTFGKNEKYLYVINELNSTISVFEKSGLDYKEIETVSTLSPDFQGKSFCADIHLSKDGRFLYGSNRGENTIVVFEVNQTTGTLNLVGREDVRGDWPRNFTLDPNNTHLLVANQRSNNITVFKRDSLLGTLSFLHEVGLPSPVCLEFLK